MKPLKKTNAHPQQQEHDSCSIHCHLSLKQHEEDDTECRCSISLSQRHATQWHAKLGGLNSRNLKEADTEIDG